MVTREDIGAPFHMLTVNSLTGFAPFHKPGETGSRSHLCQGRTMMDALGRPHEYISMGSSPDKLCNRGDGADAVEVDKGWDTIDSVGRAKVADIQKLKVTLLLKGGQCVTSSCGVSCPFSQREVERTAELLEESSVSEKMSEVRDKVGALQSEYNRLPEHLRCVMPPLDDSCCLTPKQARQAVEIVLRFEDCFVHEDGKVGWTDQATHSIDTGDNRPVKQPPRRTGFVEKDVIEKQLQDLLREHKIQASESPWASPVLLIKKRDRDFAFDYRRL